MRIGVIFRCYGGNIVVIWLLQAKMGAKIAPIRKDGGLGAVIEQAWNPGDL